MDIVKLQRRERLYQPKENKYYRNTFHIFRRYNGRHDRKTKRGKRRYKRIYATYSFKAWKERKSEGTFRR